VGGCIGPPLPAGGDLRVAPISGGFTLIELSSWTALKKSVRGVSQLLNELDNYLQKIQDHHKQIIDLIDDLPREGLNFFPITLPDLQVSNSIAVLTTHIVGAEHHWIGEVVGGLPVTRDRASEFTIRVRNAAPLIEMLNNTLAETRTIFSKLSENELDKVYEVEEKMVPGRWAILHVIDHTSLHLGHMQLTYQLWAKGDSKSSPFWFSRLPPR
jgi:uncharacterized damage-inducible protein DinB